MTTPATSTVAFNVVRAVHSGVWTTIALTDLSTTDFASFRSAESGAPAHRGC